MSIATAARRDQLLERWAIQPAMAVLLGTVLLAVAGELFPAAVTWSENIALTRWLFPTMPPFQAVVQALFFLGCVLMAVTPVLKRMPVFIVLQANAIISTLIPAANLTAAGEVVARLGMTYAGIAVLIALAQIPVSCLWQVLDPRYWWRSFAGRNGPVPAAVLGTECLGFGFALMGTNELVGWILAFVANLFLFRFSTLQLRTGQPIARHWVRLNLALLGLRAVKIVLLLSATLTRG
jgi:hypothetical protein